MKNLHVLPTDKPSRLFKFSNQLHLDTIPKEYYKKYNIYITSDEEIKEGDWFMSDFNSFPIHNIKELSEREGTLGWEQKDLKTNLKIILTTDPDLIKDSVQAIDDEFLEWFVKNPSCKEVEVMTDDFTVKEMSMLPLGTRNLKYKITSPKYKPKKETLEEVADRLVNRPYGNVVSKSSFIEGAKWQAEKMGLMEIELNHTKTLLASCEKALEERDLQAENMYIEEEVQVKLYECLGHFAQKHNIIINGNEIDEWFNQFKKK
jgi:hypothetical protein